MPGNDNLYHKIEDGFDFVVSHFQEPTFPRRIMTKGLGYQVEVFNKQEAMEYFKKSKYQDCRINAYPSFTNYHGINLTPISFLMVDLDLKDFGTTKLLERALNKTKEKIGKQEKEGSIGGNPTVLWTGNGYHIYQPVSGLILEEYETFFEFTKYLDKDLTSLFIQFAEEYFTDYTADRLHHPTVKSCLVRIPGSLNSKFIAKEWQDGEIKIIQRWDGIRPSIQPLIRDFRRWLIQKRIDDVEELKKQEKKHARFHMVIASRSQKSQQQNQTNQIKWIENGILEKALADHRKYVIWRILSPYLLNVRKLPKEESYLIMKSWLDRCNKLERLTFSAKAKIREGLRGAGKGYYPISLEKLKEENKALYDIVTSRYSNKQD
jgi:Primase X